MEFVKQHEELYSKTHAKFKDKQRKEGLWERLAASRNLSVNTVEKWFETQRTRYGKHTHTKTGQAAVKSTERQTWLRDSFSFLRGHIRRKGVSKSSSVTSPLRPSFPTASVPDTTRETESEMEINMAHKPDLDQFKQMRSMISSFLGARQDTTPSPRQMFCNYLYSEIEHLEERDFLTFRNEASSLRISIAANSDSSTTTCR